MRMDRYCGCDNHDKHVKSDNVVMLKQVPGHDQAAKYGLP